MEALAKMCTDHFTKYGKLGKWANLLVLGVRDGYIDATDHWVQPCISYALQLERKGGP